METVILDPADALALARQVLLRHQTSENNAGLVARALVAAEIDGRRVASFDNMPRREIRAACSWRWA